MKKTRQTIEALAEQTLSKDVNDAVDGIELHLIVNTRRAELQMMLSWGKTALLVLSLMKFWNHWKGRV